MSLTAPNKKLTSPRESAEVARHSGFPPWLLSWEVYLVALVAGFLRFYFINTTEFDVDQAMLFRMAQDAVHRGLLPTTSNAASIGIANPPGVIFLFMPLALFGRNPVLGALLVSTFTTAAAVLTYLFTRRYYGPVAAIIAALLYASAAKPLNYARFIWQPNLMPPFVVLFMLALFFGVVDRRKGWLLPALFLFGVLYQMHPTTVVLAAPLLVALLLSPGTFRWRDVGLALILLLVIFFPYLLGEFATRFADIRTIFTLAKQRAHFDSQAIRFYLYFLSPYDHVPTYPTSIVRAISPWLAWLRYVVSLLTAGGFLLAFLQVLLPRHENRQRVIQQGAPSFRTPVRRWWFTFRANPYRCGLLVVLIWQIVPLLVLSRHAVDLHAQYFFLLLPGPFLLAGLFCAKLVEWGQQLRHMRLTNIVRYGVLALAGLVIVTQCVGSMAAVVDATSGNFDDRGFQPYPYHNDLQSLQNALTMADQLAQQRHLNHVYITIDAATQTAIRYLAEEMQTPTTLFDVAHCLVLPNPAAGPAVMLVGPYDALTNALLKQFANAHLIAKPARLGGPPFQLYVVTPVAGQPATTSTFTNELQLQEAHATPLQVNTTSWLATRWTMLRSAQPAFRTTYSYALTAQFGSSPTAQAQQSVCTLTALRAGDQMLVVFRAPAGASPALPMTVQAQSFVTTPYNPTYGPFHLETDRDQSTPWSVLHTSDGKGTLTIAT